MNLIQTIAIFNQVILESLLFRPLTGIAYEINKNFVLNPNRLLNIDKIEYEVLINFLCVNKGVTPLWSDQKIQNFNRNVGSGFKQMTENRYKQLPFIPTYEIEEKSVDNTASHNISISTTYEIIFKVFNSAQRFHFLHSLYSRCFSNSTLYNPLWQEMILFSSFASKESTYN